MFKTEEFDMNMQGLEINEDKLGKVVLEVIVALQVPIHEQFKVEVADTWHSK